MATTLRPIRSDADHEQALAEVRRLWGAEPGSPEADALEVLAILIDVYERTRWPIERVDAVAAIEAHLATTGLGLGDLAELVGSEDDAAAILGRRRRLTIDMVARLSDAWKLHADWLVQPYELVADLNGDDR